MEQEYHPLAEASLMLDIDQIAEKIIPEIKKNVPVIKSNMHAIRENIRIPVLYNMLDGAELGAMMKKACKEPLERHFQASQYRNENLVLPYNSHYLTKEQQALAPLTVAANINGGFATSFVVQYANNKQLVCMTNYPLLSNLEHYSTIIDLCEMIRSTNEPNNTIKLIDFFVAVSLMEDSKPLLLSETEALTYYALQRLVKTELRTINPVTTLVPYPIVNAYNPHLHGRGRTFQVTLHDNGATVTLNRGQFLKEIPLLK
jgi:hypothetical protein